MSTISDYLAIAVEYQRAGRLSDAEPIYRMILDEDPDCADALQLLGVLLSANGDHDAGAHMIARAIALDPQVISYHHNLGNVLQQAHRYQDAVLCHQRSIQIDPNTPEPYNSLGNAYAALGKADEAIHCFMQALRLRPSYPEAYNSLSSVLSQKGHKEEAAECCRQALRLQPDQPAPWNNLGCNLLDLGKAGEAARCFEEAVRQRPDFVEALNNLGNALRQLGQLEQAAESYQRALCIKPDYADALSNIASVWRELGHPKEAETDLRRAIAIQPDRAEYHNNLGAALEDQNRFQEAINSYADALRLNPADPLVLTNAGNTLVQTGDLEQALACYEQALAFRPDCAEARFARATTLLLKGDFARGWSDYESRWKLRNAPQLPFTEPRWDGGDISGKRLFVFAEQGLGDTIHFIRYAPLLKAKGATIIVECQRTLLSLLQSVPGVDEWVAFGDPRPPFDFQVPLQSVPGILNTTLDTIPAQTPYLSVPQQAIDRAAARVPASSADHRKIGIVWAGNPNQTNNRRRSIPLACFEPLARVPDAEFFSLQLEPQPDCALPRLLDPNDSVLETAATIMHLDLVITADTMMAHLAGALGRPVWVLLSFAADWRYLLDRPDSPWYPTMRLFRQPRPGDWDSVIAEVSEALIHAHPAHSA